MCSFDSRHDRAWQGWRYAKENSYTLQALPATVGVQQARIARRSCNPVQLRESTVSASQVAGPIVRVRSLVRKVHDGQTGRTAHPRTEAYQKQPLRFAVDPLPDMSIAYFALDNVQYHGANVSIAWDPTGQHHVSTTRCLAAQPPTTTPNECRSLLTTAATAAAAATAATSPSCTPPRTCFGRVPRVPAYYVKSPSPQLRAISHIAQAENWNTSRLFECENRFRDR